MSASIPIKLGVIADQQMPRVFGNREPVSIAGPIKDEGARFVIGTRIEFNANILQGNGQRLHRINAKASASPWPFGPVDFISAYPTTILLLWLEKPHWNVAAVTFVHYRK